MNDLSDDAVTILDLDQTEVVNPDSAYNDSIYFDERGVNAMNLSRVDTDAIHSDHAKDHASNDDEDDDSDDDSALA